METPTTPAPANSSDIATKADLFALDLRLGERFTVIQDGINGLSERLTQHEALHLQENRESVVEKEVKLDAKKVGVLGVAATLITIISTVVAAVAKSLAGH